MWLNKISICVLISTVVACSSSKNSGSKEPAAKEQSATAAKKVDYAGPPTIVYKTQKDYKNNVPITLSDDGKTIVSYPAPSDVYYKGVLAYPTPLANGYLLDNRGLNVNSVFTKFTYEEYSKLSAAPDMNTLYASIIVKSPFLEMYNCGNRYSYKNEVEELNGIINSNSLANYKKLK